MSSAYAVVALAAMSVLIGLGAWQWAEESRGRTRMPPPRAGVGSAVAAFFAGVAGAEIPLWSGFVAGSGVLAVFAVAGLRAGRRGSRGERAVSVRTTVPDAAIGELCLVRRRSGEEVRRVPGDDQERGWPAEVRQLLPAEVERRDPAGFRRWLGNGSMTGTEPLAFLRPDRGFAGPGSAAADREAADRAPGPGTRGSRPRRSSRAGHDRRR